MSLKAIDIQMAIHRNDEAGLRQNQLTHKPEVDQSQLGQQMQKQAEREQQQAVKAEQPAEAHLRGAGTEAGGERRQGTRKARTSKSANSEAPETKAVPHPFKGHFIDLSF